MTVNHGNVENLNTATTYCSGALGTASMTQFSIETIQEFLSELHPILREGCAAALLKARKLAESKGIPLKNALIMLYKALSVKSEHVEPATHVDAVSAAAAKFVAANKGAPKGRSG